MNSKFFRSAVVALMALVFSSGLYADEVWIDVRSAFEHKVDSIDGDTRISHDEIVQEVSAMFPAKDTEIRLYCRSGGRAGEAMAALEKAGYRDVKNMGSIDEARAVRGIE
ncbi:MAG: phage shock protein E [Halioglobus sp.]|jgi:phage shock protein E